MRINKSTETFSLSGLREWIEAVRDAQYDTDWLSAIDYAASDRDAVVVISGTLFESIVERATRAGIVPQGHLRAIVERSTQAGIVPAGHLKAVVEDYRGQLGKITEKSIPKMTCHYRTEGLWIRQRPVSDRPDLPMPKINKREERNA
jgi:hypothetical protein